MIIWGWRPLEADFQRYYGIDISTKLANMTFRRFLVLISMLPGESSTAAFQQDRSKYFLAEVE